MGRGRTVALEVGEATGTGVRVGTGRGEGDNRGDAVDGKTLGLGMRLGSTREYRLGLGNVAEGVGSGTGSADRLNATFAVATTTHPKAASFRSGLVMGGHQFRPLETHSGIVRRSQAVPQADRTCIEVHVAHYSALRSVDNAPA